MKALRRGHVKLLIQETMEECVVDIKLINGPRRSCGYGELTKKVRIGGGREEGTRHNGICGGEGSDKILQPRRGMAMTQRTERERRRRTVV